MPMSCSATAEADDLLQVENLTVEYGPTAFPTRRALQGVSFSLRKNQCATILGESGSGKTTLARTIVQLLPSAGRVIEGTIVFGGQNLTALSERRLQAIRGPGIAMMFQEPALALNPVMQALDQVYEVIRAHSDCDRDVARRRARELLDEVHLNEYKVELAYPHEMSGGQRQRLLLAMSLACKPSLLIADEPTSAVDDDLKGQISLVLKQARERYGLSILWITHDPQDVTNLADRVLIFYAGQLVEDAPAGDLVARPLHPYTRLLLAAAPQAADVAKLHGKRLPVFSGPVAHFGCAFAPRCPERLPACSERQPRLVHLPDSRRVRCVRYGD